ncbi:uncharacterized protein LOC122068728 isoform X2 [Macadamia integrifolia]|uniref:uncharacterized protein LOC122068728 isoform X2 n=1 Tax=Macadamia integrifolia TaxID=60698 RepID=UPI001C4E6253|nr:uncharacterized protein LOC122068728 isoform X2 [Macadamia integrifolia]
MMICYGTAPAPLASPLVFHRLRFTTPYWPRRCSRATFCSCKRCGNTEAFVCFVGSNNTSSYNNRHGYHPNTTQKKLQQIGTRAATSSNCNLPIALLIAAMMVFSTVVATATASPPPPPEGEETLSNIPQMLLSECASPTDCKQARIQRPKSRKAESCTIKCVTTCIRGGAGSPGLLWSSSKASEAVNTAWWSALTSVI